MNSATVNWLNALTEPEAAEVFRRCCGASCWCEQMASRRPYRSVDALVTTADSVFDGMNPDDWLEAFSCHPQIGDLESLKMKYAGNREWSAGEQQGIAGADEQTLQQLAHGNEAYENRFGYLFIVCAHGKSAREMLSLLETRLQNTPEAELQIAAMEQQKITRLRLEKVAPPTEADSS